VSVVARAGDHSLPGEVVTDEAATSEAIHSAAHPGRTHDADGETDAAAGEASS
jgi:hypothetical protein